MRFALDVSKASSRDGLGSYVRGLLGAFARLEPTPALRLFNLLGAVEADELAGHLGELPADFALDLERWQEKTSAQQDAALRQTDALLATSWTVPAVAPPGLFIVYDLTFFTHPECHTLQNRLHCAEGVLRARLRGDAFAAISQASARQLSEHLGLGEEHILIAEPAAAEAFKPPTTPRSDVLQRVCERHGLGDIEGFVLSVGSLEPRKNLGRLLAAHERLPAAQRQAYPLLLVGGGGWRQADFEQRLTKGADAERASVRRLGAVSEADLVDLFGAATVFAYPSLAEGFGLPVLEAMTCGAPVITSNVSSLPEVAGSAALLVDPLDEAEIADALGELLENGMARQSLREKGFERAKRFSWTRTAERLLTRLHEIAR